MVRRRNLTGRNGAARVAERRIVRFEQDDEQHWVAELECGHRQHVRHTPPWQTREWVLTEAGRAAHLGSPLQCPFCEAQVRDG
jgi:hypothetical protein